MLASRPGLDSATHFDDSRNMDAKQAVAALGALAQDSRLAVFRLLVARGPDGFPAGEIATRLEIPGPTLSFHLKALAQADLLEVRREGRFLHYSANFARMGALVAFLTENCCGLAQSCDSACPPSPSETRRIAR
jgi:ArsR family transcriptional regulator, arsenate/arsenite/antimonite-responsive transcriptional repressor